jgi:hypothetical protein
MTQYYTYIYYDSDWMPYYVGKGKGNRAHEDHRHITVPSKDHITIQNRESESLAFEAEKILITLFGRQDLGTGPLLNVDEGGRAPSRNSSIKGGTARGRQLIESGDWRRISALARTPEHQAKAGAIGGRNYWRLHGTENTSKGWELPRTPAQLAGLRTMSPARAEAARRNGLLSNGRGLHNRWHVTRGIVNPLCSFCEAAR